MQVSSVLSAKNHILTRSQSFISRVDKLWSMTQKAETDSSPKRKTDNMHVQPGTSQIKCNKLQVWFTLGKTQADSDSLSVKHAFADSEKVSRLLEPVKSSKSCFFGHRLTSNFHNVNYNSNEFYMYWREYSLWNQADREKILGQSGLGACESARSLEALPPRLRRF